MSRVSAAERRDDFVRAAVVVIATHGVDGATTRRIAEQASAPLASLHYCFHTKEQLFAAVNEELSRVLREEVFVTDATYSNVVDSAVGMLRRIMNWYAQESDFSAAAVELILWARRQHGDIAVKVYDEAFEVIRGVLAQSAGDETPEAVMKLIPPLIASLSDGYLLNWLTYGEKATAGDDIDQAAEVLEAFITSKLAAV